MPKDSDLETLKTQILAVYNTTIFSNVSSSTQRNIKCKWWAATGDIWSSKATNAFLTLTLHYINDEMEECTITLEVAPFDTDDSHTGESIKDKFLELFHKWGLDKDYCVMLVLDGASNMTLAAKKNGVKRCK